MSFFHTSTLQRRARNQIMRIKNMDRNWLDKEEDIMCTFTDYFQKLFTKEGVTNDQENSDLKEVLSHIDAKVTNKMNQDLTVDIWYEEIDAAVFQLGATKALGMDGFSSVRTKNTRIYW